MIRPVAFGHTMPRTESKRCSLPCTKQATSPPRPLRNLTTRPKILYLSPERMLRLGAAGSGRNNPLPVSPRLRSILPPLPSRASRHPMSSRRQNLRARPCCLAKVGSIFSKG
jgi:hypothetical protein